MNELKKYAVWLVTGSQDLYGDEVLRAVDAHTREMVEWWNEDPLIPCQVVWKPVVRNPEEISRILAEADSVEECVGVIAWMHTFSPAKMWIGGLQRLRKPLLHLNTQYGRDIPWESIDMEYMNLHQSAHGDREFAYILARMRLPHKTVAGFWQEERTRRRMGNWMRAAVGVAESRRLRVLRISDNMRQVAVTDGDKVEAQMVFGWQVDHYGVGDIVRATEAVTETEIDAQMADYAAHYDLDTDRLEAVRYQAREEVALRRFLEWGGFGAFHTNFQDLQGLRQLPGLAVQDLMRQGYGFAGEGDWKTAALCRIMKRMTADRSGGTAFMEDYTYHFDPANPLELGAHMLEVCPSLACERPRIRVEKLGIGDREAPARLVFRAKAGPAVLATLVDMGDRFRMIVNDIDCVEQERDMPRLPVAGVLWKPRPSLETAAEAWMTAGGAHHSVLSYALTAEELEDLAELLEVEYVHIGADTDVGALRRELRWNDGLYRR